MNRIYFLDKKDRIKFFETIKKSNVSLRKIAESINTNRSMLDFYRKGKLHIPEDRFKLLIELIPERERRFFLKKIGKKRSNWGQVIGGKRAYKVNKKKFDEGRKKARKGALKYVFDTNMKLGEDLCEFIGAIIGDGFTNKYANFYQTQITGDNLFDSDYYHNKLKPICENLFNISPKITNNGNWIRLNIYSKRLFEMLTGRFDIPAGKKSYIVTIPDEILESGERFTVATLRGMFDTDGGIGFDKRKGYKKPYVRVNYTSVSPTLIDQVHNLLDRYKIPHSVHEKNDSLAKQIQINGENNVKLFLRKIGFSNTRHLNKIKHLL
ncbi:MAG: LAGLIDADG family homing endonuclease [Candidatus Pacearchaeota archaeon]